MADIAELVIKIQVKNLAELKAATEQLDKFRKASAATKDELFKEQIATERVALAQAKTTKAQNEATLSAQKLLQVNKNLTSELNKTAQVTEKNNRNWSDFFANMLNAREGASGLLGNVLRLGTGAYLTMRSVETLGKMIFALPKAMYEASSEMEKSRIQLEALTGSYEAGSLAFSKLAQLSREKGVNFAVSQDVITRLKGFGVENEKLVPLMEQFVVATRGDTQAMSRLALVFGQVTQQGRTFGDDMRQIYNTGVPLARALADELGVAPSQLREMSKEGKITAEVLENALKRITAEGSNLRNAFDAIANKSASGAWDRAFASIRQLLGSAGEASGLTGMVGGVGRELSDTASFFRGAIEVNRFKSGDPYADLISAREYLSIRLRALQNEDIATMNEAGKRIGNPLYLQNLQRDIDEVSNDIIAVTDKIQAMERAAKQASDAERDAFLGKEWSLESLGLAPKQLTDMATTIKSQLLVAPYAGDFELADASGNIEEKLPQDKEIKRLQDLLDIVVKLNLELDKKEQFKGTLEKTMFGISTEDIEQLNEYYSLAKELWGDTSKEAEYYANQLEKANKQLAHMNFLSEALGVEGAKIFADFEKQLESAAFDSATSTLTDMFKAIGEGTSVADSFGESLVNLMSQLGPLFIEAGLKLIITGTPQGIALGLILIGYGGINIMGSTSSSGKSGYAPVSGAPVYNALGNVYNSPSLSSYSGRAYNSPQFFAFANGAGVFAEAGPEAIMPLARTPSGKLGVESTGGSNVVVQIIDQSSGQVAISTTETTSSDGTKQIRAVIRDIMKSELASGNMNTSLSSANYLARGRRRV